MKFNYIAIAALIGMAQSVKITRELPSAPAYKAEDYDEYSSTEHDDFKKEVQKAKIDTMLYQQDHKSELERAEALRYDQQQEEQGKKAREEILKKGIVMTDGLLHTGDGRVYFQDGHEVAGANVEWMQNEALFVWIIRTLFK